MSQKVYPKACYLFTKRHGIKFQKTAIFIVSVLKTAEFHGTYGATNRQVAGSIPDGVIGIFQ
jgi:hypothetical protein